MLTYFSLRDAFSFLHITYHGGNFTVLSVILQLLSAFPCRLSTLGGGREGVGLEGSGISVFAYFSHIPSPQCGI